MKLLGILCALALAACADPATPKEAGSTEAASAVALPALDTTTMEPLVAALLDARVAAVRANPSRAAAWADLGFALDAHMLLKEAEACLEWSVQLDPTDFRAAFDLAFVGTLLPTPVAEVSRRFASAALLKPAYAPVFARHGDYLLATGDGPAAAERFRAALAVFDGYEHARLGLARALLGNDVAADTERAVGLLVPLFEAYPGDAAVATALGQGLAVQGRSQEAAAIAERHRLATGAGDLRRVPVLDTLRAEILELSRSAASNFQRGEARLRKNDLAGAVVQFERVIGVDPGNRQARLMLAAALIGQRQPASARVHLEQVLAADAHDPAAHALLGQIDTEAGRFDAAVGHFDDVARRARPDEVTYRAWVTALGSLARWDEAIFRLDEWKASAPTSPEPRYLGALALSNAGRFDEARAWLAQAVELAPEHPMRKQLELRLAGK